MKDTNEKWLYKDLTPEKFGCKKGNLVKICVIGGL
ncbi:hypothetical protein C5S32_10815 [ANME-1 cluster archaeon GoMg1]|nr:hypothetical protein [ANME-1 cluster archaeon GoMg1]